MEVTDVKLWLATETGFGNSRRILAYCDVHLDDCFVIRDCKVVSRGDDGMFVSMPERAIKDHCPRCHFKNSLKAAYCNNCGGRLVPSRARPDNEGKPRYFVDVCYPINQECRAMIVDAVMKRYHDVTEEHAASGVPPVPTPLGARLARTLAPD